MALGVLLLPLYVAVESSRAMLSYALLNSGAALSPSLLTFASEASKLAVAITAVLYLSKGFLLPPSDDASSLRHVKPYLRFAVPALLYAVNNVLFLEGLKISPPALLQVAVLAKLPLTALLHHFVVRRRSLSTHSAMWLSLVILFVGLLFAGAPEALYDSLWDANLRSQIQVKDVALGPMIGLTIAVLSAMASVWTELQLALDVPFWTAQVHLYAWGALFTGVFALSRGIPDTSSSAIVAYLTLVPVTAFSGLLVASILRQRDNLVKLVGASLSITVVYLLQHLLFPKIGSIQARAVFGIGTLSVATWSYNYYKDVDKPATGPIYLELATTEDGEIRFSEDQHKVHIDDSSAPASSNHTAAKDPYRPTPARLTLAAILVLLLTTLASFAPTSPHSVKRDIARYFAPRGLQASQWGEKVTQPMCLFEKMGSTIANNHSDFIGDIEERLPELGCPLYPLPDGGLITHIFWSGPWRYPSHSLVTDAWLATQRLKDGHRLRWWYEGEGPDAAFLERYTSPSSPYAPYVEITRFDEAKESAGSCLEGMREWSEVGYAKSLDMPIQTKSDIVRTLLLRNYGGVWLDTDTIPLRDFSPLIRMGPSVPRMGDWTINNHFLIYGPSWSGVGARMLELICEMPYNQTLFEEKYMPSYGGPGQWYWLYNEGLHRLAEYQGNGIYGSPLEWLDVQINGWSHTSIQACELNSTTGLGDYSPSQPLPAQFHGPFTWHARMTKHSDTDACYTNGSPLSALVKRVAEILEHLDLGEGRDLFPGPGYVSSNEPMPLAVTRHARRWGKTDW